MLIFNFYLIIVLLRDSSLTTCIILAKPILTLLVVGL
jgi:hypothetical protein